MGSNNPAAPWHPATMPNFNPGDVPADSESSSQHQTSQALDAEPSGFDQNASVRDASLETIELQESSHAGAFLDQFDDEDPEAAAWDLSTPAETVPMPQADHELGANTEEPAADEPPSEPAVTSNAAKHSSTVSFARTVSHEVSFMDDEEVEWNVQRTDTDPFDFMGPDDRTNSFPAVPPTEERSGSPPPLTQAQDILHDMERDAPSPDLGGWSAHEHGQPEAEESAPKNESFQQFVGGDLADTEQEAADARFEEGLPLISHEETEQPAADSQAQHPTSIDLFANEDDGDDFFSQAKHEAQSTLEEHDFDHTLHRKSTTMVLGEAMQSAEAPTDADLDIPTPTEEEASNVHSTINEQQTEDVNGETSSDAAPIDVDAKWAAAFDDDDDEFLLDTASASDAKDKELDPNEIFGSDDEGFLEDTAETSTEPQTQPTANPTPGLNGHYAPGHLQYQPPQSPYTPYAPQQTMSQPQLVQHPSYVQPAMSTPTASIFAPPPRPDLPKPQSFVDKSKGGYQSPYDLPMDVVKPKKRASMLQLPRTTSTLSTPPSGPPSGPPRSASMYNQPPPPSGGSTASLSPPGSSHSPQIQPSAPPKAPPQLKNKPSFFEDLPMTSRPRPGSRHSAQPSPHPSPYIQQQGPPRGPLSAQSIPSPGTQPPVLSPPAVSSPMLSPPVISPPMPQGPLTQSPGIPPLVAPELVSPYANLQPPPQPPVSTAPASNRYSPAPPPVALGGVPPPAAASRYSPAPPPVARSHSVGYTPTAAPPPPTLPHQPRTSSPLAHFEITNEKHLNKMSGPVHADGGSMPPRANSHYEPRLTRLPSLPPTQEVEEESPLVASPPVAAKSNTASSPAESRYSPRQSHTPPPLHSQPPSMLSPPKRPASNYMPQTQPVLQREANFVPPPRPQTQSPTAFRQSDYGIKSADAIPRPSSVQGPTSPRILNSMQPMQPAVRARGISQSLSLIPPTDGREADPLERWKGAPLVQWGVGGVLVTSFTKDIPRYGMNQSLPMIMRSPGEVKIKHIKDILPLEERLAKFPGPLKGKGKKKESIAWLTTGIESLESSLPNATFQQHFSREDKRAVERALLWKILRVFVENDGVVEGTPAVEKAVRDIISPGSSGENPDLTSAITSGVDLTGVASSMTNMQADSIDSSALEQIRNNLLSGDREKAVWAAVDKRLWGHAMLIANTSQSADLYKQVAQEFIKKEVNYPGHSNESLAALYSVLSTNFDECVDELVPVHARAGLQLMSTTAATAESKDALVGLDKWRETLGMILSNRSQGDVKALTSLGNLLSTYGRAEAAHICYIFARTYAVFGGLDDPNAHFVLVGADHRRQADQFGKDAESLLLSEVYEYGLSLTGGLNVLQGCPHLAAYKLQHAATLAEHGFKDKALQYCEAIANAMMSQTKRSPYYNHVLESAVDDLAKRLRLAPKEGSSSWISKPSMDKVSSNMWTRFNKFVAGEDTDAARDAPAGESGGEVGPFSRIAGGTPTISPSPSMTNFGVYSNGGLGEKPPSGPPIPTNRAASRYGPAPQTSSNPYDPNGGYNPAPRSSLDRTSGEYTRKSNEIRRPSYGNPYSPETSSRPTTGYQGTSAASQSSPYTPAFQASPSDPASSQPPPSAYPGYTPYNANQSSPNTAAAPAAPEPSINNSGAPQPQGYQPLSYGYEPPSINSFEPPSTQTEDSSTGGGYEPPSFQPSTFEPPSYNPDPEDDSRDSRPKKTLFDDDDDDIPALKQSQEKSKAEKDRENQELFRKVAEEEAKRAAEAKPAKKGWGLGSWFGGGGKKDEQPGNKPIKAKLGEQSSFVYDPDLKRWVNKKPGAENTPAKTATPPPPRSNSATRAGTGTPPPPMAASHSAPPPSLSRPPSAAPPPAMGGPGMAIPPSQDSLLAPPMMKRSVSNQSIASAISDASGAGGPPGRSPSMPPGGRPATSLSNASSIDDLLGAAGTTRRAGSRKPRKSGRYVDVMAK